MESKRRDACGISERTRSGRLALQMRNWRRVRLSFETIPTSIWQGQEAKSIAVQASVYFLICQKLCTRYFSVFIEFCCFRLLLSSVKFKRQQERLKFSALHVVAPSEHAIEPYRAISCSTECSHLGGSLQHIRLFNM